MRFARITLLLWLIGVAPAAHAEAEETVLWTGMQGVNWSRAEASSTPSSGAMAGAVGARYGLDDFWELAAQLGAGATVIGADRGALFGVAFLEARYTIDALTWVPWVCAGGGTIVRDALDGDSLRADVTGHLGVGTDYRPAREWGLSFAMRAHVPFTDPGRSSGPVELTAAYAWYLD